MARRPDRTEAHSGREPKLECSSRPRFRRRKAVDRLAAGAVRFGGALVILSIIGILIFLVGQVIPLWQGARVEHVTTLSVPGAPGVPAVVGIDERQKLIYWLDPDGHLRFLDLESETQIAESDVPLDEGATITAVEQSISPGRLALGTSNGVALLIQVDFNPVFQGNGMVYNPDVEVRGRYRLDAEGGAITQVTAAGDGEEGRLLAGLTDDGRLLLLRESVTASLFGPTHTSVSAHDLSESLVGEPTVLALDGAARNLFVGTGDGRLIQYELSDPEQPERLAALRVSKDDGAAVTALGFLLGGRSLMIGDSAGGVNVWFQVRDETAPRGWRLRRAHELHAHSAAITALAASGRNRSLLSADAEGGILLQHATTERMLVRFGVDGPAITRLLLAPKGDGALAVDGVGMLHHWRVDNRHPESSWRTFFGKIWYEGYDKPEYVWQSTGGSDEFEPKLSLIPLIFGTLKGTFYSMILALPLAVMAALYTSQFMSSNWRHRVKPAVEIMAALPSVVLGFLAGLWLAPLLAEKFPGMVFALACLPVVMVGVSIGWRGLPLRFRARFAAGFETALAIPVVMLVVALGFWANGAIEGWFFSGDFNGWLFNLLERPYEQRNAMIVGMAMGFAVIPIVYTISEDALSNVPGNLVSGSLALGASPWQTAVRVVLPTASGGIFSAVMIGFGRAVGETMIVLMATGNTPIMDWTPLNGFRALSANIAVEVPEAPVGGTLYRTLFLSALLLFGMTIIVNTVGEIVRQRMRQKFGRL